MSENKVKFKTEFEKSILTMADQLTKMVWARTEDEMMDQSRPYTIDADMRQGRNRIQCCNYVD